MAGLVAPGLLVVAPLLAAAPAPARAAHVASAFTAPTGDENIVIPNGAGRREESAPFDLPSEDMNAPFDRATQGLIAWFIALGQPGTEEAFGSYVVRAAKLMLGRPYGVNVEVPGQEVVDCDVSRFQCESYVESSLAVARCGWMEEPSAACFRREVARMRYRHGNMNGFGSRLHYFEDWLSDNAMRGIVNLWSGKLGGKKMQRSTAYMTDHMGSFPALQDGNELRRVVAAEHRLSHRPIDVVLRHDVPAAERLLQNGDVVAIVTRRPDILVHHAGLVEQDADRSVHLLHASSAHRHVMRTTDGIAAYLAHSPERQGILVARPVAPPRKAQSASKGSGRSRGAAKKDGAKNPGHAPRRSGRPPAEPEQLRLEPLAK